MAQLGSCCTPLPRQHIGNDWQEIGIRPISFDPCRLVGVDTLRPKVAFPAQRDRREVAGAGLGVPPTDAMMHRGRAGFMADNAGAGCNAGHMTTRGDCATFLLDLLTKRGKACEVGHSDNCPSDMPHSDFLRRMSSMYFVYPVLFC